MINIDIKEVELLPITVYNTYIELAYKLIGAIAGSGFDMRDDVKEREEFLEQIEYFKQLGWFN